MNEESEWTTFHNAQGKSNIDLTIANNQTLQNLTNWKICEEDSCSEHSIIKFCIGQHRKQDRQEHNYGTRYIINEQTLGRFERNLIASVATKFQKGKVTDLASLDNELATQAKETCNIEKAVDKLQEAITMVCDNSFRNAETKPKWTKYKSVPWCTQELTIKRKRLNALRIRYQRTCTIEQRETHKKIYHEEKSRYQAAIKKGKTKIVEEILQLNTKH